MTDKEFERLPINIGGGELTAIVRRLSGPDRRPEAAVNILIAAFPEMDMETINGICRGRLRLVGEAREMFLEPDEEVEDNTIVAAPVFGYFRPRSSDDMAPNGWLSPEGRFYACEYGEHDHLAIKLGMYGEFETEEMGWVRVTRRFPVSGRRKPTRAQANFLYRHLEEKLPNEFLEAL